MDIQTPSTFPDRAESFTSVDLYQTSLFIEQVVEDNVAVSVSGRRSYADILAAPILNSLGVTFRLPRYYDFQTQITKKMPFGGVLQTIFFLSDDKFAFTSPSEDEDEEETVNAAFWGELYASSVEIYSAHLYRLEVCVYGRCRTATSRFYL